MQIRTGNIQIFGTTPWGFRLAPGPNQSLVVSKIRRDGKAENAGLREGDEVLSINGKDSYTLNVDQALQIIENESQRLSLRIRRCGSIPTADASPEHKPTQGTPKFHVRKISAFESVSSHSSSRRSRTHHSNGHLPKSWHNDLNEGLNEAMYELNDDDDDFLADIKIPGMRKVLHEPTAEDIADFPRPPNRHPLHGLPAMFSGQDGMDEDNPKVDRKKKLYSDSAFYSTKDNRYPTIQEQVNMARTVTAQLFDQRNQQARGYQMFMKRLSKAQAWEVEGGGERRREADGYSSDATPDNSSDRENESNTPVFRAPPSKPAQMSAPRAVRPQRFVPESSSKSMFRTSTDQNYHPGTFTAIVTTGGSHDKRYNPSPTVPSLPLQATASSPVHVRENPTSKFTDGEGSAYLHRLYSYKLPRPSEFKPTVKQPPKVELVPIDMPDITWRKSTTLERTVSEKTDLSSLQRCYNPNPLFYPVGTNEDVMKKSLSKADLERIKLDKKNRCGHDELSPELAWNIAQALKSSTSKGARKFAERRSRTDKYIIDESNVKRINWRPELDRTPHWMEHTEHNSVKAAVNEAAHHKQHAETGSFRATRPSALRKGAGQWRPIKAPSASPQHDGEQSMEGTDM